MDMRVMAVVFIIAFFGLMLYLGMRGRDKNSSEDYFLGSRQFSPWVLALTFIASWYGGSSCIVSSDQAFLSGYGSFWVTSAPNALAPLVLLIFAGWIRNLRVVSMVQVSDKRYNTTVSSFLTIVVVWYMVTFAASQVVALGTFFSAYFGFSYASVIFFGTAIVMVYSMFGGFRGVVITDNAQFYFLAGGMLILAITAVKAAGGFGAIGDALAAKSAVDGVKYFSLFENFSTNFMYVISFGLGWVISADGWQRVNAARSAADAKKMLKIVVITFIPLGCLSLIVGMAGAAIFDTVPEGGILPALITTYMSPVLGALVFVGIGAAIMSTMSTAINTGAMTLAEDIYRKFINPKADSRTMVIAGMVSTVIVTALAVFIALRLNNILWVLWMSSDILMCAVFCPLLGGFLWKRANSFGALLSMIGGTLFVLYNQIIDLGASWPTFWPGWPYRLLVGLAIAVILYIVGSLATKPEPEKADAFFRDSRAPHDEDVIAEKATA